MSLADRVYDWLWFYLVSLRKVVLKEPKSILHDQGRDIYQIGYLHLRNNSDIDKNNQLGHIVI